MSKREIAKEYPPLLTDLADQLGRKLVEAGLVAEKAADIAFEATEHIRTHWGGQPLYIPYGKDYVMDQVYLQIFNEFNGSNHAELGLKYEKSVVRIYQIIKQVRKKMLNERQGSLFEVQ